MGCFFQVRFTLGTFPTPLPTHGLFDVRISFLKQGTWTYRLAIKSDEMYTPLNTAVQDRQLKQPSSLQTVNMHLKIYRIICSFPEYLIWKQSETVSGLCFLAATSREIKNYSAMCLAEIKDT